MPFEAVPLSGSLGAEIRGVDVASLDDAGFAAVHAALLDHGVICFRDQELDPGAYLAFAKRWGDIHLHPHLKGLDDRPEIIEIVREADDPTGFADHWHTDQSFTRDAGHGDLALCEGGAGGGRRHAVRQSLRGL